MGSMASKELVDIKRKANRRKSPLLQLPGELRNKIYEYIKRKANSRESPLFRLPGELRNKIYEYVLTESTVFCRSRRLDNGTILYGLYIKTESGFQEMNQMKYTCAQLHMETRGLGLKWNQITFPKEGALIPVASVKCAHFLDICSQTQLGQLNGIRLLERGKIFDISDLQEPDRYFHLEGVSRLVTFSREYQNVEILLVLDCVIHPRCFVKTFSAACVIKLAFRGALPELTRGRGPNLQVIDCVPCYNSARGIVQNMGDHYGPRAPSLPANFRIISGTTMPENRLRLYEMNRVLKPEVQALRVWCRDGF